MLYSENKVCLKSNDSKVNFKHTVFEDAVRHIHNEQGFNGEMMRDKEMLSLVEETNRVLIDAIQLTIEDNVLPPSVAHKLQNDTFIFSGFKTLQQMKEVSGKLTDNGGKIKPFSTFLSEVRSIDEKYNKNYLRAEYDFAVGSSLMAGRWHEHGDADNVMLQYRTAGDDRVRSDHALLHNVTLPKSDPFWDKYYPPNGWGCRCTVVEVLSDDYEATHSEWAQQQGDSVIKAQGKAAAIFRFNPGKDKRIFPSKHPYYACREMGNCDKVNLSSNNKLCSACRILCEVNREKTRQQLKQTDKKVKEWLESKLEGKNKITIKSDNLKSGKMMLSQKIIKRYLGHAKSPEAKELLININDVLSELKYIKTEAVGVNKDKSNASDRKNIAEKQKRGVKAYNYYTVERKGYLWAFQIEAHKDNYEQLYGVTVLKKEKP